MKHPDLIIIGAGAAGLMCAITAAKRGRRVLVLERSNKLGKKILMSGGGKCNFTNLHVSPDRYVSANPHFCKSALSRYTQWDFIDWVEHSGIDYFEKKTVNGLSGQLFCRESSKQIVAMLVDECRRLDVQIKLKCETVQLDHGKSRWLMKGKAASNQPGDSDHFHIKTEDGMVFESSCVVIATGGLSVPSLGGSGFGYELASSFGLNLIPGSAGLVPFTFTDSMQHVCKHLSGVSIEVILSTQNASFREDMLFTHRGLSGPASLQLSSYWQAGDTIKVNVLPGENIIELLHHWKLKQPKSLLRNSLATILPRKLVLEFEQWWWPSLADTSLAEWPNERLSRIADLLSNWKLKPSGTEGYRTAEVTLGGLDTKEISSKTMESSIPGLFFTGEMIDVTGHLGGFNFQWAWSSGYAAGVAA